MDIIEACDPPRDVTGLAGDHLVDGFHRESVGDDDSQPGGPIPGRVLQLRFRSFSGWYYRYW